MPYKDPERRKEYARDWIRRNPERARDAMRRWRTAHPEDRAEDNRSYYDRHRETRLLQIAAYHRAHPEVVRVRTQNRRARKAQAEGSFSAAEWLQLVEQYGGRCAYRGEAGPLQAGHRMPLCRGGSNRIENILPACGRCNAEKGTMTEQEFRARLAAERDIGLKSD